MHGFIFTALTIAFYLDGVAVDSPAREKITLFTAISPLFSFPFSSTRVRVRELKYFHV